jgi:hypothetical protein
MTTLLPVLAQASEGPGLPVFSGLFPILALVAFGHADKTGDLGPHGPAHH